MMYNFIFLCGKHSHVPNHDTACINNGMVFMDIFLWGGCICSFPDLALRCLVESYTTCCDGEDEEPAPKRSRAAETEVAPQRSAGNESTREDHKPVAGIVIALCCHHKCDWTHYVGREFFKSVGLGPVEFHYFQRMSSWATCGMRETTSKASTSEDSEDQTDDTEEHEQTLSRTESGSDTLQGYVHFLFPANGL